MQQSSVPKLSERKKLYLNEEEKLKNLPFRFLIDMIWGEFAVRNNTCHKCRHVYEIHQSSISQHVFGNCEVLCDVWLFCYVKLRKMHIERANAVHVILALTDLLTGDLLSQLWLHSSIRVLRQRYHSVHGFEWRWSLISFFFYTAVQTRSP